MIAQHFALRYPEKVRSLILAVTYCGGPHSINGSVADMAHIHELPLEEAVEAMIRLFVTEEFINRNPDIFRQLIAIMVKYPPVHSGLLMHTQAIATHDTYLTWALPLYPDWPISLLPVILLSQPLPLPALFCRTRAFWRYPQRDR